MVDSETDPFIKLTDNGEVMSFLVDTDTKCSVLSIDTLSDVPLSTDTILTIGASGHPVVDPLNRSLPTKLCDKTFCHNSFFQNAIL